MSSLAYTRQGAGPPLVLLHGLGSMRDSWNPVIPLLAERFDVVAVDLPGFGDSEPLPPRIEPLPAALAAIVADFLQGLGITSAHLAGHSLGGWMALELAAIHPAASLTLVSPAGLWRGTTPLYQRISLRLIRWGTEHATGPLCRLVNHRLGRVLVLGQTHARSTQVTPAQARAGIVAMGRCPGFTATYKATARRRYLAGAPLTVPTTVAFGSRDLLLLPGIARHLDELPPRAYVGSLPGCGHVCMSDDPAAVAALITDSALERAKYDDRTCG
ncbi:alpha/beta fold hydrolase [Nonomuraea gerenzanensis]|uniref:Alpha/beta hydrolase fold n=1 Tax=Nonomuraea gerenzanensis TaxID=93944 RepID=A0A1M4EFW3_9ACTN|nr:alpha/beta fold hydrolase [Nonomuraea gerenzanensis]UBU09287.1 alpha/beta fold hydrolase [Nonomuraea gerenzanensis]SBO97692.1 alpha/beta hydrolase fold [Nonomuraea gerenzanensis]